MIEFKILLPNKKFENIFNLPSLIAKFTLNKKKLIMWIAFILLIFSLIGILKILAPRNNLSKCSLNLNCLPLNYLVISKTISPNIKAES